MLISFLWHGCHDVLSLTGWFKTTEFYASTGLKLEQESAVLCSFWRLRAQRSLLPCPFLATGICLQPFTIRPISASVVTWCYTNVGAYFFSCPQWHLIRTHHNSVRPHLNLIIYTKTPFSKARVCPSWRGLEGAQFNSQHWLITFPIILTVHNHRFNLNHVFRISKLEWHISILNKVLIYIFTAYCLITYMYLVMK